MQKCCNPIQALKPLISYVALTAPLVHAQTRQITQNETWSKSYRLTQMTLHNITSLYICVYTYAYRTTVIQRQLRQNYVFWNPLFLIHWTFRQLPEIQTLAFLMKFWALQIFINQKIGINDSFASFDANDLPSAHHQREISCWVF
jgi:hypothetical protein